MTGRLQSFVAGLSMSALLAAGTWGAGVALAATPAPLPASAVPHPGQSNWLNSVAAVTPDDAWAVGYYCPARCKSSAPPSRYLIMHWDGKAWSVKATGSGSLYSSLYGVSAESARDAWAVGYLAGPLFLHWDGKHWSRARASIPGGDYFLSVAQLSARDAWAVGAGFGLGGTYALVAHWNGRKWARVAAPTLTAHGGGASLSTISADSPDDIWATGGYCASGCGTSSEVSRAAVLHWNGRKWSRSVLPVNPSSLSGVSALSPKDVWVTGNTVAKQQAASFMLHWNGTRWSRVTIPNEFYMAMTFVSASDGWALPFGQPAQHWNGARWSQRPFMKPGGGGGINAASGDRPGDVWAVGELCLSTCGGGPAEPIFRAMIMHWNGSKWSRL